MPKHGFIARGLRGREGVSRSTDETRSPFSPRLTEQFDGDSIALAIAAGGCRRYTHHRHWPFVRARAPKRGPGIFLWILGGGRASRTLPCLLPFAICANGDANPAGAKLQDFRAVPGLDQSLASPPRKSVDLAPLAQGHYALIVKRAVTFTAVGLLFCFAKRHAANLINGARRASKTKTGEPAFSAVALRSPAQSGFSPL
jgi:hypothetical protein